MKGITNSQNISLPRITWTGDKNIGSGTSLDCMTYFGYNTCSELLGHIYIIVMSNGNSEKGGTATTIVNFMSVVRNTNLSAIYPGVYEFVGNSVPYINSIEFNIPNNTNTSFIVYAKRSWVSSDGNTNWQTNTKDNIRKIVQIV